MSTLLRLTPATGYRRSTALLLKDGRVAVLRMGPHTWNKGRGWLALYQDTASWEAAMDLRTQFADWSAATALSVVRRTETAVTKVTLPPGKYFVGDPYYGMNRIMYTSYFGPYGTKDVRVPGGPVPHFAFRLTPRNETLEGSDGLSYDLGEQGRIGIMNASLVDWSVYGAYKRDLPAQIYTFPNPVTVRLNPAKERYSVSWKDIAGCWNELVLRRESDWACLKKDDYHEAEEYDEHET